MRSRFLGRAILPAAAALVLAWATTAAAQRSYYLFLEGKGTASLTVSENTRTAYIIDGGDKGESGIVGATIDGKDVLAFLKPGVDYDYLVIACSHPDSDHMEGLAKLVREDERMFRFKKVFFVESGFYKDRPGHDRSLFDIYTSRPGRPPLQAVDVGAAGVDAYATIDRLIPRPKGPPNAELHNFVYTARDGTKTERRDPHGHSVVHRGILRDGGLTGTFADLDDANDALVAEWVAWVKQDPASRQVDYLVLPHHGSSYTDILPLMAQDVRPRRGCVIPVNPNNQYFHPGARNLLLAYATVGVENVHITGDGENIKITPEGLPPITDPRVRRRYFDKFIHRQLALNDREIAHLEELDASGPTGDGAIAARERLAELRAARADLLEVKRALLTPDWKPDEALVARLSRPYPDPPPPPTDDPGGPPRRRAKPQDPRDPEGSGLARNIEKTDDGRGKDEDDHRERPRDTERTAKNEARDTTKEREREAGKTATRTEAGAQAKSKAAGAQAKSKATGKTTDPAEPAPRAKARPNGENVGNYNELRKRLDVELARARTPVPPSSKPGGVRFARALRIRPVFGGIMLGNERADAPKVLGAAIRLNKKLGGPVIEVTIEGEHGKETARLEDLTSTELWCAYHFVHPEAEMTGRFGVEAGECGLVGIDQNLGERWTFGIHPAIANTILARDGMRLDMAPALPDGSLFDLGRGWTNYQWYDDRAVITAVHGNIRIGAATAPADVLLRLRLWGDVKPAWFLEAEDKGQAIEDRIDERVRETLASGLDKSPEYLLPGIEDRARDEVNAEARGPEEPIWYTRARDKDNAVRDEFERRVAEMAKAAGIADAPCYRLPRIELLAHRSVFAEIAAEPKPAWYRDARDQGQAVVDEIARRRAAALAAEPALADSPFARVRRMEEEIGREVRAEANADAPPSWYDPEDSRESIAEEIDSRLLARARAQGLDRSPAFLRTWLREISTADVLAELEGNVDLIAGDKIEAMAEKFDALRRIDRFARAVAALRWLDDAGHLPELPDDVRPIRMDVPPRYQARDVVAPRP